MGLRNKVFDAVRGDTAILALLAGGAVFPNFAVDSPASTINRWIILRWGAAETPAGRDTSVRAIPLTIAAFDREKDFAAIDTMLKRIRVIMRALETQPTGDGWVLGVSDPAFSSDDGWDDGYAAVVRSETYRIVASGI